MADLNLLSQDVEIKGTIRSQKDLFFDGKLEGNILSSAGLTVGQNGEVKGEIKAKSVSVLGRVTGNISVQERCELKANAHLIGDLHAPRLIIEEGATFVGKSEVNPSKATNFTPELLSPEQGTAKPA